MKVIAINEKICKTKCKHYKANRGNSECNGCKYGLPDNCQKYQCLFHSEEPYCELDLIRYGQFVDGCFDIDSHCPLPQDCPHKAAHIASDFELNWKCMMGHDYIECDCGRVGVKLKIKYK